MRSYHVSSRSLGEYFVFAFCNVALGFSHISARDASFLGGVTTISSRYVLSDA